MRCLDGSGRSDLVEKAAGLGQNALGGQEDWSERTNASEKHPNLDERRGVERTRFFASEEFLLASAHR